MASEVPVRLPRMRSRALRSLIGCLAAYAVTLQVAVSGLLAIASLTSAHPVPTEICSERPSGAGHASGDGGHHFVYPCGPACLMSTCAAMLGATVAASTLVRPPSTGALPVPRFARQRVSSDPAGKGPHCPRAPPRPDILAA